MYCAAITRFHFTFRDISSITYVSFCHPFWYTQVQLHVPGLINA